MPLSADMLDRDMRAMFADLPQTVAIRRAGRRFTAPCSVDEAGGGGMPHSSSAGMETDASASVTVAVADCEFAPAVGDAVSIGGDARTWRISSVRRVPGDAAWQIELGEA